MNVTQNIAPGRVFNSDPQKSAQPCGCDPGAQYHCDRHSKTVDTSSFLAIAKTVDWSPVTEALQSDVPCGSPSRLKGIEDSGKRQTYSSGAMRDPGEGKLKWSRIFFGPMARRWAQHLTTAEAKYPDAAPGVPNFSLIHTLEEKLRYKESALRHFMSWYHDETNEDHASAVFFNINGVEIIKAKERGEKIDGIRYGGIPVSTELGSVLRNEEDYAGR